MANKRSRSTANRSTRKSGGIFENKVAWISGAIILLILVQIFVMRDEGLYSLLRLKQEIRDMESHITRLEIEKAELESERDRLLNDPDYLERIARERFRMAKPGEKVFHVVTETKRDGVRDK
ncbi:MAG: septum formation initiator family protein [FCB group bacterium]|nr:septum formation initiator family protein [FCB group bacterium]MBL7027073.1 septum formation initiator family protein [Candidatus Neomarinimicrobiota bacterium]MBL7122387.1 septum formation initiator family protein [Candidatus Neomarinimicrobiota bacterium]